MAELEHSHHPKAIAARLDAPHRVSYLRDYVYGGIDGAVTTFAIVAGVAGAELSVGIVLILGLANLLGDGFSMAAGNFSGTRSEVEEQARLRVIEQRHIRHAPEGEREEVRQIFAQKGFEGDALEAAVATITADEERWIAFMLNEEYGIGHATRSPWRAAWATFAAFLLCGAAPLLPYLLGWLGLFTLDEHSLFALAAIVTGLVFVAIGSAQSFFSEKAWWRLGLETLLIGGSAALIAYGVGWALRGLAA
ncbi:MAG: VIT1/CCC1 transporter family protein [Neomegalonema sp.]|nr:VIT1/CCC1 transporter family protein [Neomegalonema sp.]